MGKTHHAAYQDFMVAARVVRLALAFQHGKRIGKRGWTEFGRSQRNSLQ
jgi:isoprenylcysteine carboxyl methyltransferase (ICMT) family protein YpbQ